MAREFQRKTVHEVYSPGPASNTKIPDAVIKPAAASITKIADPMIKPAAASVAKITDALIEPTAATSTKLTPIEINKVELQNVFQDEIPDFGQLDAPLENTLNEELNRRTEQIREDNTEGKSYSVGIYDIDEALGYYFRNVIKPTVYENNQIIPVEVLYGNPERWAAMQQFGYYRDNKGKLVLPLIMYRKTSVSKNESLQFPRVNTSQLHYITKKKWNVRNRYDKFSLLTTPNSFRNEYDMTAIANYITISYECIIWTAFAEQTNGLIEKINFSDGSYWGDKNKFKFRTILDSYDTSVELSTNTERVVKCTFNLSVYGYILPEYFNDKKTTEIAIAPKKLVFAIQGDTNGYTQPYITNYDAQNDLINLNFNQEIDDMDFN